MTLHKAYTQAVVTALALLIAAATTACSDNGDDDEPRIATLYDIVEVTDIATAATTFTVYRPDASNSPVRLTAPGYTLSGVETGTSVFLAYTPENGKAYTSGNIAVESIGSVNNSNLKRGNESNITGWDDDPVWLQSLWQAGEKVCVRLMLPYSTEPRRFALVIDEETADNEYPDAYLFHRRNNIEPNFQRQYYGAFNLSELWKMPECRGLRIHVANSNVPALNLFTIDNPHYQQPEEQ